MPQATVANQLPLLKRLWGDKVPSTLYQRSKLVTMMKKDTSFGGEGRYVVVNTSGIAGTSADFATAQANQKATDNRRFFVTHRKEYAVFTLQGDLISRTKGNANAMVESLKHEVSGAMYSFGRAIAARAWGNGGGSLGRVANSTFATPTLTLTNRGDVTKFEVGMVLRTQATDGSGPSPGTPRVGSLLVVSIDRTAGTVTMSGNLSTGIAAIAQDDFIFRDGDYANAMTGVPGWNPQVAPTPGESFMGLDRTTGDVQRLSGLRYNGNSDPYEEMLIQASAEGQMHGISGLNQCWVNPLDYAEIVKEVGVQKEVRIDDSKYGVGFTALYVKGPDGDVMVVSETDVPQGHAWMNRIEDFVLRTSGPCPQELAFDNGKLLQRLSNDDAYEGRLGAYGNFFNENPGNSVQITW